MKYLFCVCSKSVSEVLSKRVEDQRLHHEVVKSGNVKTKLQAALTR